MVIHCSADSVGNFVGQAKTTPSLHSAVVSIWPHHLLHAAESIYTHEAQARMGIFVNVVIMARSMHALDRPLFSSMG